MRNPHPRGAPALLLLLFASLMLFADLSAAQEITFTQIPRKLELFARDATDSATVTVAGTVSAQHDSVRLEVLRNGQVIQVDREALAYQGGIAGFQLSGRIHAELSEYSARVFLDHTMVARRDSLVCGDVFLINGQSNAAAWDQDGLATARSEWFRSFGTMDYDPGHCLVDTTWGLADGHGYYSHAAVGVWGLALGLTLVDRYQVPVAILNGAVGGTEILSHLRTDGYHANPNTIYGRLLYRAEKAGVQNNVRAILWHQGESDTYDPNWTLYRDRFTLLWNAWHEDYHPIEKVYLFQIHQGCGENYQSELREVQRTLPAFFPGLEIMSTVGLPGHDGCHYGFAGYNAMASWVFPLVARDLYGSTDTLNITPPAVLNAWFPTPARDEVRVRFDGEVVWPADSLGARMQDYFFVNGASEEGTVASGRVLEDGRTISLTLAEPVTTADLLTYLPGCCYAGGAIYEGPWVRNPRGIGALSFFDFPIETATSVAEAHPGAVIRSPASEPNPFDRTTRIRFSLASPQVVTVEVFDARGRRVRTLVDHAVMEGDQAISWSGTDARDEPAAPGVYFYRITTPNGSAGGRMVVAR